MTTTSTLPALRDLPVPVRLGIACLVLVMLGGLAASAAHLRWHYQNRDERPGLTIDDITGAFHGVDSTAPLLAAVGEGHPDELPEADRAALIDWLTGDRVSEDFDNLDLGDRAPAEIMAMRCLDCHSRQSEDPIGQQIPLDYWDDVRVIAFSRQIQPTPVEVLANSTHAHALSMSTLSIVVAFLALMTAWPRRLVHAGILLAGLGLLGDIGAWWLTRSVAPAAWLILGAGALYNGMTGLLLLGVLIDLVRPGRAADR